MNMLAFDTKSYLKVHSQGTVSKYRSDKSSLPNEIASMKSPQVEYLTLHIWNKSVIKSHCVCLCVYTDPKFDLGSSSQDTLIFCKGNDQDHKIFHAETA